MKEIAGGTFQMGLTRAEAERLQRLYSPSPFPYHREMPEHRVEVRPFLIDEVPVTNEKFAAFVQAGGYSDDLFWEALLAEPDLSAAEVRATFVDSTGRPGPLAWINGQPPPGKERHPVSGVSWYEARAYCRFRGYRLPAEAEWELAARGKDGRLYPWGNEFDPSRCAHREVASPDTVPVDSMASGQSPFGVAHMAGNVAEWVEDRYAPYPGAVSSERFLVERVLRNDFFLGTPESLRVTVRTPRNPVDRFRGLGFRCAADLGARVGAVERRG